MPNTLTIDRFEEWLRRYGAAWEARDPQAAAEIFSPEGAEYYWTPLEPPKCGLQEIAQAWGEATSRQQNIRFSFNILTVSGRIGIARWQAALARVGSGQQAQLDGILVAEFDDSSRCRVFREWWHSTYPPY
jgi:hypothetical protein